MERRVFNFPFFNLIEGVGKAGMGALAEQSHYTAGTTTYFKITKKQ